MMSMMGGGTEEVEPTPGGAREDQQVRVPLCERGTKSTALSVVSALVLVHRTACFTASSIDKSRSVHLPASPYWLSRSHLQ
jgi:hypothetical protein